MSPIKHILVVAGTLILTGCPHSVDPVGQAASSPTAVASDPTSMPPSGPDRSTSIAGVDTNGDGVRDDIERLIEGFSASRETKSAARQFAKTLQVAITTSASQSTAYDNAHEIQRAISCLSSVDQNFLKYSRLVQAKTLNTAARSYAWLDFEKLIGGRVFQEPDGPLCE